MDWSYGYGSKGSNNKMKDKYHDCDEKGKQTDDGYGYPYEDDGMMMSKPAAVVVDGGQRKNSITRYPNVDGSDSYVVRTERVVKVVRPVMATHYSLKENPDNLGMVNSFLDKFLKESGMYAEHCQFSSPKVGTLPKFSSWEDIEDQDLSHPSTGTRRNWPTRDESPPRSVIHPQWNHPNHSGGRHDWPSRDDSSPSSRATLNWSRHGYDSPPRFMARPELSHLSSSARPSWPSRDDCPPRSMVRPQLSHHSSGVTQNWSRQYDSPPRSMEYPNSSARPSWPSQYNSPPRSTRHLRSSHSNPSTRSNWQTRDDSPPRVVARPELSYPNSSTRPNWSIQYNDSSPKSVYLGSSHPNSGVRQNWSSSYRDKSPPRPMEYPLLSNHNSSAKPNWSSHRVESAPRSRTYSMLMHPNTDTKPNWSSRDDSPLRSTEDFELNRSNSSIKSNWQNGDHSLPKSTAHPELNHSNSNTKPNWQNRDDSPQKSTKLNELSHSNSSVKPNWPSQNSSSPKSNNHPRLNGPNPSSIEPSWTTKEDSPNNIENGKDMINTGLVLKKFDEELNLQESQGTSMDNGQRPNWPNRKGHGDNRGNSPYKSNKDSNGAQTKNTKEVETPDINNHKFATQKEDPYKIPYTDGLVQDDDDDDSKKRVILGSSTNVSKTKPNYTSGWHKQPNPPQVSKATNESSDIMNLVEEAKKTSTYDPNEITPNPPHQQVHYSTYVVPAAPWGYYKPVLDSNQALRKYNGITLPNSTYRG